MYYILDNAKCDGVAKKKKTLPFKRFRISRRKSDMYTVAVGIRSLRNRILKNYSRFQALVTKTIMSSLK